MIDCYFGWSGDPRVNKLCDEDTELTLGLMVFEKIEPMFVFKKNGESKILWVKGYEFPDPHDDEKNEKNSWLKYWWIAAIVLAVLIVVFILVKALNKDNSESDFEVEGEYNPV